MAKRQFLGVHYKCCNTYGRAYLNDSRTFFAGRCPKCLAPIRIQVSSRGSTSRFFSVE